MPKKRTKTDPDSMSAKDLIYVLDNLLRNRKFKKQKPLPIFKLKEVLFIRDLIFWKPKDLVFYYIADDIRNRNEFSGLFNTKDYRMYDFMMNFLKYKGNSTKAAIASGYSPRSAKQQGHRVLLRIQNISRRIDK